MHTKEEKLRAFGRLLDIQDRLRKECPWDRKQTYESLRPNTIEEVFELCDALMNKDYKNICKELGDVLEHVVFYAMLGSEESRFDIADVCNAQCDKLMFRHDFIDWNKGEWYVTDPDMRINANGQVVYNEEEVNGDSTVKPTTAEQVASTWEMRKQHEKNGNECVLSGVPKSLPSLVKAYRIQDKARGVGSTGKTKPTFGLKYGRNWTNSKPSCARTIVRLLPGNWAISFSLSSMPQGFTTSIPTMRWSLPTRSLFAVSAMWKKKR